MVVFPNCKINLGLHVLKKRPDNYHDIETAFYPIGWKDILEITENNNKTEGFIMSLSGIKIEGGLQSNLIYKAWKIMSEKKQVVPVMVHLHKNIPMGAGLGGGSSDAANFINLFDQKFNLGFTQQEKTQIAAELGSDCSFFLDNKPVYATEKGDKFKPININLSAYYILIVNPGIHSDTKSAYDGLIPRVPEIGLLDVLKDQNFENWKKNLLNDFESSIFKKYPEIANLKKQLYDSGAAYASMSGSGSSVFGIFTFEPKIMFPKNYRFFLQKPTTNIL